MIIDITPVFGEIDQPETEISVAGDTITVDGTSYDLSDIPDGGEVEGEDHPFVGPIRRENGVVICALRVILGPDAARSQPTDLAHWRVEAADGPVEIPAAREAAQKAGD